MLQSSSNPLFADLYFNVVLFLWGFWVGGWGWIVCTILFMSILSCTCALDNLCNTHLELIIQGYILLLHQKLNLMHNLWNLWNNYYIDLWWPLSSLVYISLQKLVVYNNFYIVSALVFLFYINKLIYRHCTLFSYVSQGCPLFHEFFIIITFVYNVHLLNRM